MNDQLGEKPFDVAYEAMYGLAEMVYTKTGSISAHLAGLDFQDGEIAGVGRISITGPDMVNEARSFLLTKYPMVAQISEAWAIESTGDGDQSKLKDENGNYIPPSQHPDRIEIVMIILCTKDVMCMARCPVDPKTKSISKGELMVPDDIIGGRQIPQGYTKKKMDS